MIEIFLEKINEYALNPNLSFFVMEPEGVSHFLQIAKVGEDFLLDIPASQFYDEELVLELEKMVSGKYRKTITLNKENSRLISYQCLFKSYEISKICYVARDIFVDIFIVDSEDKMNIIMR